MIHIYLQWQELAWDLSRLALFKYSYSRDMRFWTDDLSSICFIFVLALSLTTQDAYDGWYVQNISTFLNTFAVVSPLICMFWMQLTWTNSIFSRIALVSHFCAEIQLSVKIWENIAKILFHQKTHGARRRDGEGLGGHHTTRGRGPGLAAPTYCVTASVIASTPPSAYIYPLT
jgi:hypothetical protein